MFLPLLPLESPGNPLRRVLDTVLRPFHDWGTLWGEVYRGTSLGAPYLLAYLWVLGSLPLLYLVGHPLIVALRTAMPSGAPTMAQTLQGLSAVLGVYLVGPLVAMGLVGLVVHGILWLLEPEVRGRLRVTLRVVGYAVAWLMPFVVAHAALVVHDQVGRLAALGATREGISTLAFSGGSMTALGLGWMLDSMSLGLAVWGLTYVHRSPLWKTLVAGVAGWAVGGFLLFMGLGISQRTLHGWMLRTLPSRGEAAPVTPAMSLDTPKANPSLEQFQRMTNLVREARDQVAQVLEAAGLPAPPRALDLLTGGDAALGAEVQQAGTGGVPANAQLLYLRCQSALKGQVVFLSDCVGESGLCIVGGNPDPLPIPGSEALVADLRGRMTGGQQQALIQARKVYLKALVDLQVKVGPFLTPNPMVPTPQPTVEAGASAPPPSQAPAADPPWVETEVSPRSAQEDEALRTARGAGLAELQRMAQRGSGPAMCELGLRLFAGREGATKDQASGVRWLEKAYKAGFADKEACYLLWVAYSNGWGVVRNPDLADRWKSRGDRAR